MADKLKHRKKKTFVCSQKVLFLMCQYKICSKIVTLDTIPTRTVTIISLTSIQLGSLTVTYMYVTQNIAFIF